MPWNWNLPSAIRALAENSDPKVREDAEKWIGKFIIEEVANQHPLMLGAIAESLLDALKEVKP